MTIGPTDVNITFGLSQSEAECGTWGSIEWKFLCSSLFTCSLVDHIHITLKFWKNLARYYIDGVFVWCFGVVFNN